MLVSLYRGRRFLYCGDRLDMVELGRGRQARKILCKQHKRRYEHFFAGKHNSAITPLPPPPCSVICMLSGGSDHEHSFLPKRKLDELVDTPNSRSSGGDVDGFFASGSPEGGSGGSGGYKARDARAGGGGAALTPVVKRRAILYDRSPHDRDASYVENEAAAAAASALLAVRSSDGPKR